MNYYLGVLKKYAVFSGRAQRAEYWYFLLVNLLISIAINFLGFLHIIPGGIVFALRILLVFVVLIPGLAVAVRRLHDTNHSGWWLLIGLIPFVGIIVLIVLMVIDSDSAENKYGPSPKGITIN